MRMKRNLGLIMLLVFVLSVALTACSFGAKQAAVESPAIAQKGYKNPQYLADVETLQKLMNDPKVVIVDVRPAAKYMLGHIKGAVNVWRDDYEDKGHKYPGMLATKEQWEKLLGSLGISNDSRVIIYTDDGDLDAARFWWALLVYGHQNMQLLDGGLTAWKAKGLDTTMEKPAIKPATYTVKEVNTQYIATTEDVEKAMNDKQAVIVDARATEEYTGKETKAGAVRKGRIPGAVWIEWTQNLNADKTFKSAADLKAMYEAKGVTPDKLVIPYCQSGVRSAHAFFALKLLGYENVKNYDGSWIAWSREQHLPIETDQK